MKIVLGLHEFLPDYNAGTEIITLDVARELLRRGHDVRIVTGYPTDPAQPLSDSQRFDHYQYEGLPVDRFRHAFVAMDGQRNIMELEHRNRLFAAWFADYLRDQKPDLVHFFNLARISASAIETSVNAGLPTYFTATDFWAVCPAVQLRLPDNSICSGPDPLRLNCLRHVVSFSPDKKLRERIEATPNWMLRAGITACNLSPLPLPGPGGNVQSLLRRNDYVMSQVNRCDAIIVPSKTMAEMLTRHGATKEKLLRIPYGIRLEHITRHVGKGAGPLLHVSFVGTLTEHKGCHILVEAVKSLPTEVPIALEMWGPAKHSADYERELKELSEDDPRIVFKGGFDHELLDDVLAATDVLVVPSLWYENTPMVIYEAQAAGCAVVATDLPGMAEVMSPDEDGLLFECGSVAQLSRQLKRLAEDRALVAKLAGNAPMPLSVQGHIDQLEALYAQRRAK